MAGEIIAFFFELFFEIFGATAFSKKTNKKLRWAIFLIILIGGSTFFLFLSALSFVSQFKVWSTLLGMVVIIFTIAFAVSYTKSFLKSLREEQVN